MSHKATTWLSGLAADIVGNSEFRVLFHLCDCHNPSSGCFPTQAYLLAATGVSNGTLNNALNSLEQKGFIRRKRWFDNTTKRRQPTRYILGFEFDEPQEPSPKTGEGNGPEPSPKTGDGAISKKHPDPSPKNTPTHLQPTGEVTCKEPVINPRDARAKADPAALWADRIVSDGGYVPPSAISVSLANEMLARGLVTKPQLRERSIVW